MCVQLVELADSLARSSLDLTLKTVRFLMSLHSSGIVPAINNDRGVDKIFLVVFMLRSTLKRWLHFSLNE